MGWILLASFLAPAILLAIAARRIARFARILKRPERLGALMSVELREAIRRTGLDPDALKLADLKADEELARRIAHELRPALLSSLLGGGTPAPAMRAVAPPTAIADLGEGTPSALRSVVLPVLGCVLALCAAIALFVGGGDWLGR